MVAPVSDITYDLVDSTAGSHGCSTRYRLCCKTACSGNHFSDALWDACHATFSDFHSSVVQSRIGPPQTSQPIQTRNAGGNRGTRRSPVFALVIALPNTELHDYFAFLLLPTRLCCLEKALQQEDTDLRGHPRARSQWAHWRVAFSM